jgi:DNA mismatch repair protein MSH5
MPSHKRKRDSVFSTSYNPSNLRRFSQRGDEQTRLSQGNYSSNRSPRASFSQSQRPPADSTRAFRDRRDLEQDLEQDADEDLEQVVMAIDIKERGTVGCCYYVAQEEKLYILGDVQSGGKEVIETCSFFLSSRELAVTNIGSGVK